MNKSRVVILIAMGFNGGIVATLDPTLAYRLKDHPFDYNSSLIGLLFMASSVSYIVTSIPTGYLLDNSKGNSSLFKIIQGIGFVALVACFGILGPIYFEGFESAFNNPPSAWAAMILKGIGSSGANAAYPDLVIGVDDRDEKLHARLSGIWNATYAIGWALGPLFGGAVYQALGFRGFTTLCAGIATANVVMLFFAALPSVSRYLNPKTPQNSGFVRVSSEETAEKNSEDHLEGRNNVYTAS